MAQDRVYINQCSLKEKVFDNGGSLINAAFKVSELQEYADDMANNDGYFDNEFVPLEIQ